MNRLLLETTVNFFKRDIKARYAGSRLGLLWVVIKPLSLTGITSLVFSLVFKNYIRGVPYFLFTMIGFSVWTFFSESISLATKSLVWNRNLIKNTNFSNKSVVISAVLSRLIDFVVSFVVLVGLGLLYGRGVRLVEMVMVVILLLGQVFFQVGLGLAGAAINVYYRDTESVVEVLMRVLFYLTPVVYPAEIVPEFMRGWLWLNPAGYLVMLYRMILFDRRYEWGLVILFLVGSGLVLGVGLMVFEKMQDKFAELI